MYAVALVMRGWRGIVWSPTGPDMNFITGLAEAFDYLTGVMADSPDARWILRSDDVPDTLRPTVPAAQNSLP